MCSAVLQTMKLLQFGARRREVGKCSLTMLVKGTRQRVHDVGRTNLFLAFTKGVDSVRMSPFGKHEINHSHRSSLFVSGGSGFSVLGTFDTCFGSRYGKHHHRTYETLRSPHQERLIAHFSYLFGSEALE